MKLFRREREDREQETDAVAEDIERLQKRAEKRLSALADEALLMQRRLRREPRREPG